MEYFIGYVLMQGMLYRFGVYVISKEHLRRDSVVSPLWWEVLASYLDTACIGGIWREFEDQCRGITLHVICV